MRLSPIIGACALLATCIAAEACATDFGVRDVRSINSPTCEAAKRSAWFERQRQLTDGDVDPAKALPAPRECQPSVY